MTKLRRPRRLTATKLVKERARTLVGNVPPSRSIPDRRSRPPKHKRPPQAED